MAKKQDDELVERVVTHPKLYLRVDGRLQHVKPGVKVTLPLKAVEGRYKGMTADPSEGEQLKGGTLTKTGEDGTSKELAAAKKKIADLEKGSQELAGQLAKAQAELAALKK